MSQVFNESQIPQLSWCSKFVIFCIDDIGAILSDDLGYGLLHAAALTIITSI
jgi:hypothetical protein